MSDDVFLGRRILLTVNIFIKDLSVAIVYMNFLRHAICLTAEIVSNTGRFRIKNTTFDF